MDCEDTITIIIEKYIFLWRFLGASLSECSKSVLDIISFYFQRVTINTVLNKDVISFIITWLPVGISAEMYIFFPPTDKVMVPTVHYTVIGIFGAKNKKRGQTEVLTEGYPLVNRWLRVVTRRTEDVTHLSYKECPPSIINSQKYKCLACVETL